MTGDRAAVHQLPNLITVLRVLLVLPLGWALYRGDHGVALVLFVLAGASDALDGWLARRFQWTSRFGVMLDPLADKLLVACVYLVLTVQGTLPLPVTALVISRDLMIVLGAFAVQWRVGRMEFPPTLLGKANTLVQICFLTVLLVDLAPLGMVSDVGGILRGPLLWLVVGLTLLSGADYARTWLARLRAWQREQA